MNENIMPDSDGYIGECHVSTSENGISVSRSFERKANSKGEKTYKGRTFIFGEGYEEVERKYEYYISMVKYYNGL